MTDSKTVVEDLAAWLTAIWDEEEREFLKTLSGSRLWGKVTARRLLTYTIRDRKILALHKATDWYAPDELCCEICHEDRSQGPDAWQAPGERPCATLKALASPYADRPGFRPEWLVERQGVEQ